MKRSFVVFGLVALALMAASTAYTVDELSWGQVKEAFEGEGTEPLAKPSGTDRPLKGSLTGEVTFEFGDEECDACCTPGFGVKVFTSGEDAINEAEKVAPDLFITGMGLSGDIDGLQYTRALKSIDEFKDIPIVLLTGARRVMQTPFCFAPDPEVFPVCAVVEKPARPAYLFEIIDKALEGSIILTDTADMSNDPSSSKQRM